MAITDEVSGMEEMAAQPTTPAQPGAPGPTAQASQGQLGGPGIDTPQEQQAIQMFMQGVKLMRSAEQADPSLRYINDKHLKAIFMDVTAHYGLAQEGKLAMQQAEMNVNRERSSRVSGPPIR